MLQRIINASLEHRFVVLALAVVLAAAGVWAMLRLPIDAFPDTTPVQVQVNVSAPALSPAEIEQQITFPIEQEIAGLPGLVEVRSISKFGFSQVTATFADETDVYFARQIVSERLQAVVLPEGLPRPTLGPVATGLGEVFHYVVTGPNLQEATTVHEWMIEPAVRSVPGVAEANTWGGERRQFQVHVDPALLAKYDLTLSDVFRALEENNANVGGGNVVQGGELHLVQGVGVVTNVAEIGGIVLSAHDGVPVCIRDVGEVVEGSEIRRGAVTENGRGEVVLGLAFSRMGENTREVTTRVRARIDEIRKTLPAGVEVRTVYDRTELVDRVLATVETNLFEGALLVIAVLFLFLGNLRAGLIVAAAIPLSLLFAFNAMLRVGIAGSLLSLGAIDFGMIVDSSVIMVENSVRHLAREGGRRPVLEVVRDASVEVRRPTLFGELIIAVVYLPILTLEGIEGKLFRPMAWTVLFALVGSMILSLTLMPVLASLLLPRRVPEREGWVVRAARRVYAPVLRWALRWRAAVVAAAVLLVAAAAAVALRTGSEFIPRLSEGTIVINTVRLAGVSLEESVRYGGRMEQVIREKFPQEVRDVWVRTGTPEVATDPMGIEVSDVFVTLRPRREWTRARTQEALVEAMREELSALPGMRMIFTQPIEMRVNEMIAGIRADVGVKVFGDDFEVLKARAAEVERVLRSIPGAEDVYAEQLTGLPVLEVRIDPEAISRFGVPAARVLEAVECVGTKVVGQVREGQRRFDLAVRFAEPYRSDPAAVGRTFLTTAAGERIPLARLARVREIEGPATILRDWQRRRIVVQCNVRGRDVGGFVAEARRRVESEIDWPSTPGYSVSWGGQFEHLERARLRLTLITPIAFALVFGLLYLTFRSVRDALLIFTGVPLACVGGVASLALRGLPFTVPAGIGFIALSGVAVLNGLVLVSHIRLLRERGAALGAAVEEAALVRLRPVLMTALVASLGFVPMALSTGVGAEVQRPLATVVIGGIVTSTVLTLVVLPALYTIVHRERAG